MSRLASNFYAWRAAFDKDPETVHVATHIAPWPGDRQWLHTACEGTGRGETIANYATMSGLAADDRAVNCAPCRKAIAGATVKLGKLIEGRE